MRNLLFRYDGRKNESDDLIQAIMPTFAFRMQLELHGDLEKLLTPFTAGPRVPGLAPRLESGLQQNPDRLVKQE
jgi:hypothetical protein